MQTPKFHLRRLNVLVPEKFNLYYQRATQVKFNIKVPDPIKKNGMALVRRFCICMFDEFIKDVRKTKFLILQLIAVIKILEGKLQLQPI